MNQPPGLVALETAARDAAQEQTALAEVTNALTAARLLAVLTRPAHRTATHDDEGTGR